MSEQAWLLRGGRIFDPATDTEALGEVLFSAEGVLEVRPESGGPPAPPLPEAKQARKGAQELDVEGCWVLPGLIDARARLAAGQGELSGEIAISEADAALAAGATTVLVPPTTEAPLVDPKAVRHLVGEARNMARLDIRAVCGLLDASGEALAELGALRKENAIAAGNQHFIANTELMANAISYARSLQLPLYVTARDGFLGRGVAHDGPQATSLGLAAIPAAAEALEVYRWRCLAERVGSPLHFSALSSAAALELLDMLPPGEVATSADTPIHNLLHTDEALAGYDSRYHLMPPLRGEADRQALLGGVRAGSLGICSNHRPLPGTAKALPFGDGEPGASSLELLLPLGYRLVKDGELTPMQLVRALTLTPAASFGLEVGSLQPGRRANLCLFDPKGSTGLDSLRSAGQNHIETQPLEGAVLRTWYRGVQVYQRDG